MKISEGRSVWNRDSAVTALPSTLVQGVLQRGRSLHGPAIRQLQLLKRKRKKENISVTNIKKKLALNLKHKMTKKL